MHSGAYTALTYIGTILQYPVWIHITIISNNKSDFNRTARTCLFHYYHIIIQSIHLLEANSYSSHRQKRHIGSNVSYYLLY